MKHVSFIYNSLYNKRIYGVGKTVPGVVCTEMQKKFGLYPLHIIYDFILKKKGMKLLI